MYSDVRMRTPSPLAGVMGLTTEKSRSLAGLASESATHKMELTAEDVAGVPIFGGV